MPVDRHLEVVEFRDFAPGLYENSDWLMPGSAAQEMTDCFPQPGGGLRAFFKGTTISASGIASAANERVIGLYQKAGPSGSAPDRHLMTYSTQTPGSYRPKLYRMKTADSETTWTQVFVTSGTTQFNAATGDNNGPHKSPFRYFEAAGVAYVIFTVQYIASATGGPGLYRLLVSDTSSTQKAIELVTTIVDAGRPSGPLTVHQARIVLGAGAPGEKLLWSDPGTLTFPTANFLDVEPNQEGAGFVALSPNAPSDMLILKNGAPAVVIQGDITDPTVQQMLDGITGGGSEKQDLGRTPYGLTFIARDGYVYLTNGSSLDNLSQQLAGFNSQTDFLGPGDTNFINEFLFAPNGYVLHWPTKSWFKQTRLAGALHHVDHARRVIWGPVGTGASFTLRELSPFADATRMDTYSWKSAPLRRPDGRQLVIREVEVVAKSYDASAQIAVTVNGTTVTQTLASAGRQKVSFLFNERDEILDVRVVPTANSSDIEAPSIEAVRVKSRSGSQTY